MSVADRFATAAARVHAILGDAATYIPDGGAPVAVEVIEDRSDRDVAAGFARGFSEGLTVSVVAAPLDAALGRRPREGDLLEYRGATWALARTPRPDPRGLTYALELKPRG